MKTRKERTNMLTRIRNFSANAAQLEELVEVSALGRAYLEEGKLLGVTAPDWLEASLRTTRKEISLRISDQLEAQLRTARAHRAALSTTEEKRAQLDAEIKELEKQVGTTV